MMLPLLDHQLRVSMLNQIVARMADAELDALHVGGVDVGRLTRLRDLSAVDMSRLAAVRSLVIQVDLDLDSLDAALRIVSVMSHARALEAYFIRHGASWQQMTRLFKLPRKDTLRRRRIAGVKRIGGRFPMPDAITRDQIVHAWEKLNTADPRLRYYELHQRFLTVSLATLEAVLLDAGVVP